MYSHNKNIVETEKWYAVYTLYRHEKKVQTDLQNIGVEAYVPLIKRIKRYKRKIRKYEIPLINNYVFIRTSVHKYNEILRLHGVIKFIKLSGKLTSIPEDDINYLKLLTNEAENIKCLNVNIHDLYGKEVVVNSGPMRGMKAKVIDIANKNNLIVEFLSIGVAISFEIQSNYVDIVKNVAI